jgi:hypothetical protein
MTAQNQSKKASVNLESESVAGEEDPGAALDLPVPSAARSEPGKTQSTPVAAGTMNLGDEAPPGTPGTAENVCRECGGSGRVTDAVCPSCNGSGKVTVGVGGA